MTADPTSPNPATIVKTKATAKPKSVGQTSTKIPKTTKQMRMKKCFWAEVDAVAVADQMNYSAVDDTRLSYQTQSSIEWMTKSEHQLLRPRISVRGCDRVDSQQKREW